jgi:bifunctional NMN adenylyltransferase/nudix hydrolase
MQEIKKDSSKDGMGVVVGRFQTPVLTDGHDDLIQHAFNMHEKVLIVIGLSPVKATKNNPMDFETRRKMIIGSFPQATIAYIENHPSDIEWSKKLDQVIEHSGPPDAGVTLYGSRDSFIESYHGRHTTSAFEQRVFTSATRVRKSVALKVSNDHSFRAGVVWATQNQYDKCFPTVDVGIVKKDKDGNITDILLGRKFIDGNKYRFVGGFVDPSSDGAASDYLEANARREVREECGVNLEVDNFEYVGSFMVDDWRYRSEKDKIVTTLFMATWQWGDPVASDDIDEVRWFNINDLTESNIVKTHIPLMRSLFEKKIGKKFN